MTDFPRSKISAAEFFSVSLSRLDEINWDAVNARRWAGRDIAPSVKEGKQAEFLMHEAYSWELIQRVGVHSVEVAQHVAEAMRGAARRPVVEVKREWYYP